MFDEAFGHKSMLLAVMNTLSLLLMGVFLYLVAHWPLLTRWLKRTSMKPGEGAPILSKSEATHNALRTCSLALVQLCKV